MRASTPAKRVAEEGLGAPLQRYAHSANVREIAVMHITVHACVRGFERGADRAPVWRLWKDRMSGECGHDADICMQDRSDGAVRRELVRLAKLADGQQKPLTVRPKRETEKKQANHGRGLESDKGRV